MYKCHGGDHTKSSIFFVNVCQGVTVTLIICDILRWTSHLGVHPMAIRNVLGARPQVWWTKVSLLRHLVATQEASLYSCWSHIKCRILYHTWGRSSTKWLQQVKDLGSGSRFLKSVDLDHRQEATIQVNVLSHGGTTFIIRLDRMFPCNSSSYWGTPMTMETPISHLRLQFLAAEAMLIVSCNEVSLGQPWLDIHGYPNGIRWYMIGSYPLVNVYSSRTGKSPSLIAKSSISTPFSIAM